MWSDRNPRLLVQADAAAVRYRELERGYAAVRWQEADAATGEVRAGLGPIVALRHRSSILSQIYLRGASAPLFLNENATEPFDAFGDF